MQKKRKVKGVLKHESYVDYHITKAEFPKMPQILLNSP